LEPTTRSRTDANHSIKAQRSKIQVVDKDVHDPHGVFFRHVVAEALGQQATLRAIFTFHKTSDRQLPSARWDTFIESGNFHTAWTHGRRSTQFLMDCSEDDRENGEELV
jgi:hypothetical protein